MQHHDSPMNSNYNHPNSQNYGSNSNDPNYHRNYNQKPPNQETNAHSPSKRDANGRKITKHGKIDRRGRPKKGQENNNNSNQAGSMKRDYPSPSKSKFGNNSAVLKGPGNMNSPSHNQNHSPNDKRYKIPTSKNNSFGPNNRQLAPNMSPGQNQYPQNPGQGPPGSHNNSYQQPPLVERPSGRGRPVGSKNKAKFNAVQNMPNPNFNNSNQTKGQPIIRPSIQSQNKNLQPPSSISSNSNRPNNKNNGNIYNHNQHISELQNQSSDSYKHLNHQLQQRPAEIKRPSGKPKIPPRIQRPKNPKAEVFENDEFLGLAPKKSSKSAQNHQISPARAKTSNKTQKSDLASPARNSNKAPSSKIDPNNSKKPKPNQNSSTKPPEIKPNNTSKFPPTNIKPPNFNKTLDKSISSISSSDNSFSENTNKPEPRPKTNILKPPSLTKTKSKDENSSQDASISPVRTQATSRRLINTSQIDAKKRRKSGKQENSASISPLRPPQIKPPPVPQIGSRHLISTNNLKNLKEAPEPQQQPAKPSPAPQPQNAIKKEEPKPTPPSKTKAEEPKVQPVKEKPSILSMEMEIEKEPIETYGALNLIIDRNMEDSDSDSDFINPVDAVEKISRISSHLATPVLASPMNSFKPADPKGFAQALNFTEEPVDEPLDFSYKPPSPEIVKPPSPKILQLPEISINKQPVQTIEPKPVQKIELPVASVTGQPPVMSVQAMAQPTVDTTQQLPPTQQQQPQIAVSVAPVTSQAQLLEQQQQMTVPPIVTSAQNMVATGGNENQPTTNSIQDTFLGLAESLQIISNNMPVAPKMKLKLKLGGQVSEVVSTPNDNVMASQSPLNHANNQSQVTDTQVKTSTEQDILSNAKELLLRPSSPVSDNILDQFGLESGLFFVAARR